MATTLPSTSSGTPLAPHILSDRFNTILTIGAGLITYGWIECGQTSFALVGLLCTATLILCQWRLGDIRPWLSLWLAVWFTSHLIGMRYGLYAHSSLFDKAMHAIITGGFVVMWITWMRPALAGSKLDPNATSRGLLLLALLFTLATAALWEIFEFGIDQTGMFRAQRGLEDTMLDMIAALVGGGIALCWETTRHRRLVAQHAD